MTTKDGESPTRRALLAAGLGALGASVVSAIGIAEPAAAASSVALGGTNSETHTTTIKNSSSSSSAIAIQGTLSHSSSSSSRAAIKGEDDGTNGVGVYGTASHGQSARGVYGRSTDGIGVYGRSSSSIGVYGSGGLYGAYAVGTSYGLQGLADGTSGNKFGVYGQAQGAGINYGVYGIGGTTGVYGSSTNVGVWGGDQDSSANTGVVGYGGTHGVYATAPTGVNNYALYAAGDAHVTGTLSKALGSFKIDHPLDPERRWLSHSFVESPDMMNVYNGNVTTDGSALATVTLPAYFHALNRDFRYQLTVIGAMANAVIDREIDGGRFRIRTSEPRVKVSWQVTGIRQDDYATKHPIVVETRKTKAERGTRQFVPEGSSATKMDLGPRHVPQPTHQPQQQVRAIEP